MFRKSLSSFSKNLCTYKPQATIIGGGFSGLYTGIKLCQSDYFGEVSILEKSSQAGGPCNLVNIEDHHFELSTQMGRGALSRLQGLGIDIKVENVCNELFYSDGTLITTPFNRMSKWNLFYPKSILKLLRRMAIAHDSEKFSEVLSGVNPKFKQMVLAMFAYPSANPDIEVSKVRKFLKDPGGHSSPIIVKNGTWNVIKSMEDEFRRLGGEIKFNEECIEIKSDQDKKTIITNNGLYDADLIVSSSAWDNYPPESKSGLPLISLFFEMCPEYTHRKGVHTTAFLPKDIEGWLKLLSSESNEDIPKDFGFHCFPNILPDDEKGITVFITTPRNTEHVESKMKSHIEKYVLDKIEMRFKGFKKMVDKTHCLSPAEFKKQFGFPSNAPTKLAPEGFSPVKYDQTSDLYFVGDSTFPESPNIYGALQSAEDVTKTIIQETIKNRANPSLSNKN